MFGQMLNLNKIIIRKAFQGAIGRAIANLNRGLPLESFLILMSSFLTRSIVVSSALHYANLLINNKY